MRVVLDAGVAAAALVFRGEAWACLVKLARRQAFAYGTEFTVEETRETATLLAQHKIGSRRTPWFLRPFPARPPRRCRRTTRMCPCGTPLLRPAPPTSPAPAVLQQTRRDRRRLSLRSTVYAGQRLRLPAPAGNRPSPATRSPSPPKDRPPKTVRVPKNDSLTVIARRHRVTVAALARANGLALDYLIHPGQLLRLPAGGRPRPALAPSLHRAIYATPVRRGVWCYIVIHHSGTTTATLRGMDEYHRVERDMENGLACHSVIGNGQGIADGAIEVGDR